MANNGHNRRLVIVSNRLPFSATEENNELRFSTSPGGLVSGLQAYLSSFEETTGHKKEYLWVGWPGSTVAEKFKSELRAQALTEFNSHPVFLSQEEMDSFYHGFCNNTIWPLFHYFPSYADYKQEYWKQYVHVNEIFRDAIADVIKPDDVIWIHDYHLMLLPKMLKGLFPTIPIGFFLHIPFPSFEVFRLLPARWRREILDGLMGADVNGFHTFEYTQHFLQSVLRILGHEHHMGQITTPDRIVKAGTFPMGLDFAKFAEAATHPHVGQEQEELRKSTRQCRVILSVDRLDYSKGILNRLEGYEQLLETHREYAGKIVLIMVIVPSRIGVRHYENMKKQIEELIGRINGRFGSVHWTPILYQYRSLDFQSLIALYACSDVALVTPLRDGMNLVAKEYVAARLDRTGVLILSEMAGAAKELGEAIIINPNNVEEIADALFESLEMPKEEQKRRMTIMQSRLRRYDVVRWAGDFMQELNSTKETQHKFLAKLLPPVVKQRMVAEYSQSLHRLIFLDYDGTLVPFAQRPHLAKPGSEVMQLLRTLSEDFRNTCILISGRDRETLLNWFGDLSLTLVAEHGTWIREVGEDWKLSSPHAVDWKQLIQPILEMYADRLPGAFVEEKEYSLAWHYRAADPEQGRILAGELMDHLVTFTANIDIIVSRGHKVLEVRNADANKGSAGRRWISRGNYDFILALGDDWTDEDLFAVIPENSYSIRVGITNTVARYNVKGPADVLRLLDQLVRSATTVPVSFGRE